MFVQWRSIYNHLASIRFHFFLESVWGGCFGFFFSSTGFFAILPNVGATDAGLLRHSADENRMTVHVVIFSRGKLTRGTRHYLTIIEEYRRYRERSTDRRTDGIAAGTRRNRHARKHGYPHTLSLHQFAHRRTD